MRHAALLAILLCVPACGGDEPAAPAQDVRRMSLAELEQAAASGRADALAHLGQRYYFGNGVERAIGRAGDLFRQAAEKGDVGSMHNLAVMLQHGQGLPQDEAQAFSWFLRAAEGGHSQAAQYTALMYKLGTGTKADAAEALRWFLKAAERGVSEAHGSLSALYFDGADGVPQDYVQAHRWSLEAARHGDVLAYVRLALMCEQGLGVAADPAESRRWMRLANATETGDQLLEDVIEELAREDPDVLHGFALWLAKQGLDERARAVMRRAADAGSALARTWLKQHP